MNTSSEQVSSIRWRRVVPVWGALLLSCGGALAQAAPEVESALTRWVAAFNAGSSTGEFFAKDALLVRANGTFRGAATIDEMEQRESKAGLRLTLNVEQVNPIGMDAAAVVSRYTVMPPGSAGQVIPGVALHVLHRSGNHWLVDAASFTRVQPPAPSTVGSVQK